MGMARERRTADRRNETKGERSRREERVRRANREEKEEQ